MKLNKGQTHMTIDWNAIDRHKYRNETEAVSELLAGHGLTRDDQARIASDALSLVNAARLSSNKKGVVESFLQEFSLGTKEGLALMCLSEALLRIPDARTQNALIAEKISSADWQKHLGQSDSLFVNASTWGLMLTGRLVDVDEGIKRDVPGFLKNMTAKMGEPVIRQAVGAAVRMMGEQFVLGRTIKDALARAKREGALCSFDMLGEGARTVADAERFERLYADAIKTVGEASNGQSPEHGHGVSVKLSALCPRYEAVQEAYVWDMLYPKLKHLAERAAHYNLNLAVDAEEADRLVLSLKLIERLAHEPSLAEWTGLGVVVQAYQKRAGFVIDALHQLAQNSERRIMVRLVKGAYWDSEIKRAQVNGRPDYPVYTTKAATDVSYLHCARRLIAASPALYPQFASHNAHTLAAVRLMAQKADVVIEHQRLHGMGEALYAAANAQYNGVILRAYAPVGGHEELLPYLVRRLLENGANSSFVHALLDEAVPPEDVVGDPIAALIAQPTQHPKLPSPSEIYGAERANPLGPDYAMEAVRTAAGQHARSVRVEAVAPMLEPEIDAAFDRARKAQPAWDALGGAGRGRILRAMGDLLEAERDALIAILSKEAGKTLEDSSSEVREAVDFCRYYAHLAEQQFGGLSTLTGPVGETNQLENCGRGVFVCISPWNFPLAIFTGQIAAALAAGNAVLAKPAEQTPYIAQVAVKLFHKAGLIPDLLTLVPGDGPSVGAYLTGHRGHNGVAFTGGTATARIINQTLANRLGAIVPFIAETGGLNAMFVDSTALKEQVVDDVIQSAFGSAGQRCSALRVLFLPKDSADDVIATLIGALQTRIIGDPSDPATDIGPVVDASAQAMLEAHVEKLSQEAKILAQVDVSHLGTERAYFGPVIAEIPSPDYLEQEVFGPILHIYRYDPKHLDAVTTAFAARGYGLTLGVHSRIDRFARFIRDRVPAGNMYVNRSMTGAVVGVQPFGGMGLSGTGPKAGGPHALLRYATERSLSVNITAQGGDPALMNL
jgi:RHH-type transcriptional regulator, proline utilization regulon repressor / proline dehydrogenase / delta 1-pyrroline-5-carboxylate dehydrogenase